MNITELYKFAAKYQMDFDFSRIKNGKKLDLTKKPYDIIYIDNMIQYYEDIENYENCNFLVSFKNDRLNHDKNYHI